VNDSTELPEPRYPVRLVAVRTGLTPHVLRAWERRYSVVTPTRSEGGQRLYSQLDIERLSLLRRLTDRGHSIGRIAALGLDELAKLDQESASEPSPAGPATGATRDISSAALRSIQRNDAAELQSVLERAAVTLGVPDFLDGVVDPTLEAIGQGWSEHSISVAQEHLSTAVFRRVLGWLLRVYEVKADASRIIVATPPGELHELGALMAAVTAAAEGWAVTYLGPNLPLAELVNVARQTGARAVALSVVYVGSERPLLTSLREARAALPAQVPLLVGGAAASEIQLDLDLDDIIVVESLADLRQLLRQVGESSWA
jgi:MerR family transcriptional regulator, light-induced transcriptional regulator